jgi:hypothetical protein
MNKLISIHKEKDPINGLKELDKFYSDYFEKCQKKLLAHNNCKIVVFSSNHRPF